MKLGIKQRRHVWLILQSQNKKICGALIKENGEGVLTYHTRREARKIAKLARVDWPKLRFRTIKVSVTFLEL